MGTLRPMGEADWWLCESCSSLNNLAARKCYSCGERKTKAAVRASEYLGYRPIVSWDGKIKLEQKTIEERVAEKRAAERAAALAMPDGAGIPALREPVRRDTLAVAPRPPNPARVTYRLDEPPRGPAVPLPGPGSGGMLVGPQPASMPGSGAGAPRPAIPVGPGPGTPVRAPGDPWPHWRELLDGPMPHADRLRDSVSTNAGTGRQVGQGSQRDAFTLRSAIRLARTGDAREFIPWPEADRREAAVEGAAEGQPEWPGNDRRAE